MLKQILLIFALGVSILLCTQDFAEAKRFGGGRSFGNRSTMGNSRTFSSAPKAPAQQNMQNRGFLGGMGGILGGVLAGTLIGSLLGGGAFGGIGFMDILLFGGIAFLLFSLFRSRKAPQQQYSTPKHTPSQNNTMWGALGANASDTEQETTTFSYPEGFNEEEFIAGAKILFTRMQTSWGERNLDDIAKFTTARVFQEIEQQAKEDSSQSVIRVLQLTAELLDVQALQEEDTADIAFTATIQEGNEPIQVFSEVWHCVRSARTNTMWKLDGIQQA